MGRFSFCLPPFAPDYSGVCGALFSLGGMVVIHDAAGCTGNYVNYDEPRWYDGGAMVYCSGLRELDAVLGNDEKLIRNICEAARRLHPNFIALVGSPVPMVIGTDLEGIAAWIEDETGIPAFGFPTTGLGLYPAGAFLAGKALLESVRKTGDRETPAQEKEGMNLLGELPLDFAGTEFRKQFRERMQEMGLPVSAALFDQADMEQVSHIEAAKWNNAVTYSGALLGAWLWRTYNMPCITGFPMSSRAAGAWHSFVTAHLLTGGIAAWGTQREMCGRESGILILGDQIIANSIRAEIFCATGKTSCVGVPFGVQQESLGEGDRYLGEEEQIQRAMNDAEISTIIGDPLYRQLLDKPEKKNFIPVLHYAVSSKVGKEQYLDSRKTIEEILAML